MAGDISSIKPLDFMQYGIPDLQHFTYADSGKVYYVFPKKGVGRETDLAKFRSTLWATQGHNVSPFALLNKKRKGEDWSYSKVLDIKSQGELPTYLEQTYGEGAAGARVPPTPPVPKPPIAPKAPPPEGEQMSMWASSIDDIANIVEASGRIKEALLLDTISNSLEKIASNVSNEKKGRIFKYKNTTIHTFGDVDNNHDFSECHPKCVHLEWKPVDSTRYGYCTLFKKDLGKCRCPYGSGAIRCTECKGSINAGIHV